MKLLPSRRVLCTSYNHAPCHFMESHIRKVYACLVVNCHLHFWQNDWGLLRTTAVTRGWNGCRNMSQHRKLPLEKNILPPLPQGFEPATFRSRVRRSNHWAIPAIPLIPVTSFLLASCRSHADLPVVPSSLPSWRQVGSLSESLSPRRNLNLRLVVGIRFYRLAVDDVVHTVVSTMAVGLIVSTK